VRFERCWNFEKPGLNDKATNWGWGRMIIRREHGARRMARTGTKTILKNGFSRSRYRSKPEFVEVQGRI
jgi:hypothetical protein